MINHSLDGAGFHRSTIEFGGTSVPEYVSTRSNMSQKNTGEEIHLVATIESVWKNSKWGKVTNSRRNAKKS